MLAGSGFPMSLSGHPDDPPSETSWTGTGLLRVPSTWPPSGRMASAGPLASSTAPRGVVCADGVGTGETEIGMAFVEAYAVRRGRHALTVVPARLVDPWKDRLNRTATAQWPEERPDDGLAVASPDGCPGIPGRRGIRPEPAAGIRERPGRLDARHAPKLRPLRRVLNASPSGKIVVLTTSAETVTAIRPRTASVPSQLRSSARPGRYATPRVRTPTSRLQSTSPEPMRRAATPPGSPTRPSQVV